MSLLVIIATSVARSDDESEPEGRTERALNIPVRTLRRTEGPEQMSESEERRTEGPE